MANLVPVGQLTMVQAHQEVTKLVDQISAKFVQLDSGEFGAVARCQNAQASCFVCPYNPTMPKARFCRGITRIHRLPSRPSHPYGRQLHSLIFMSTLYKASSRLPAKQLTNDHEPACICHLYCLRINTHVLTNTMIFLIARHGGSSD